MKNMLAPSQLDMSLTKATGGQVWLDYRGGGIDPVRPEELARIIQAVSLAISVLDLCLLAGQGTFGWVLIMVNSSLRKGVFLPSLGSPLTEGHSRSHYP